VNLVLLARFVIDLRLPLVLTCAESVWIYGTIQLYVDISKQTNIASVSARGVLPNRLVHAYISRNTTRHMDDDKPHWPPQTANYRSFLLNRIVPFFRTLALNTLWQIILGKDSQGCCT
jgi:hypothetical protein